MFLIRLIVNLLFKVSIVGKANIKENTLIIANHESFLDGLILGVNFPKAVFIVHTTVLENTLFKFLLKFVEHLAIDTTNPLAIRKIISLIKDKPIVIFPEGRITVTGSLMKVYDGAAFVAAKTGANIIPVRLNGPSFSYFAKSALPKTMFPKITINILEPTSINMPNVSGKEARKICGEKMKDIMQNMLFTTANMDNVYNMFLDSMKIYENKNFIEDYNLKEVNYKKVLQIINATAALFSKCTNEKENVGVILPNIIPTIGVILGLIKIGRVPAMLNYTSGLNNITSCCNTAQIKTIVTSKVFLEKAKLNIEDLKGITFIYIEDIKKELTFIDKIAILFNTNFPQKIQTLHDELVILFTSGSEGTPKAVVHTHSSILSNALQVKAVADFNSEDKFFVTLPTFHSFGFTCGIILPILTGSKIFLYPNPLNYKIIPEIIYDKGCTVLFGTSTFLLNYAKNANSYDFFKTRYVIAGAEKLSEQTKNIWYEKFGIRILEGYGATETAPIISVNTPMSCLIGSVGKLLPGMEYKLEEINGVEGGILHVKGPNVMKGYIKADKPGIIEPPVSIFGDGWYSTGDIVEIKNDYVFIKGRLKRFAKIAGEMVSLESVENFIKSVYPEGSHAVIAIPSENKGEALILISTSEVTNDVLFSKAREVGFQEIGIPKKRIKVNSIPILGTGKTDYVTLNKTYNQG